MATYLTAAAICLFFSAGEPERGPTAAELLQRYTRALDVAQSFISKAEIVTHQDYKFDAHFDPHWFGTDRAIKALGLISRMRVEFRTDGFRTRRIQYAWGDLGFYSGQRGITETRPDYHFSNWDGSTFCVHSSTADNPAQRGVVQIGGIERDGAQGLFTRHSESYILGYHGDERVDEVLRRAEELSVSPRMEKVGRSTCYVLKGETDSDAITLWIDPAHGYNAAKMETRRITGDLKQAKTVCVTKLENVRFQDIDSVWVPMEADILRDRFFDIGGKKGHIREKYHYKRTEFALNPDHDRLGSFDKPLGTNPELLGGTPVHKDGDPRTYVWREGKVIPDAGGSRIRSQSPGRTRQSNRRPTRRR